MKKFIVLIMLYLSIISIYINVNAAEDSNNALDFRKNDIEHKTASSAICISSNTKGDIAIGFYDNNINIYDKNGYFKYNFSFDMDGTYVFEFDDQDNLMIFPSRSNNCYYFSTNGELLRKIIISDKNERYQYFDELLKMDRTTFENNEYVLTQRYDYTKLIKIDDNGNETVIYDIGSNYITTVTGFIIKVIFVMTVIILISKAFITEKIKRKNQNKFS